MTSSKGAKGLFNSCAKDLTMAQLGRDHVVPTLLNLAKSEKDKKKRQVVEEVAHAVDEVLAEAEEVRAATRSLSVLNQNQRDALHSLIKDYSKMIDDADARNNLLREAGQIMRRTS